VEDTRDLFSRKHSGSIAQVERNALFRTPHTLHPGPPTSKRRKGVVNKSCHCASAVPSRRRTVAAAAETLAGVKITTVDLWVYMGTVVLCGIGTGVTRRRAPGRFGRRGLGLCRRWHDDFYLGIVVEDVLGQSKARARRGARWARKPIIYRLLT